MIPGLSLSSVCMLQHVLLMRKSTKDGKGPESIAASYISNRSEGHKSLASLASMMSEKVRCNKLVAF